MLTRSLDLMLVCTLLAIAAPPARLVGRTFRLGGASHTALEITLDYRATTSEDGLAGIYTRSTDVLSDKGLTLSTVQDYF